MSSEIFKLADTKNARSVKAIDECEMIHLLFRMSSGIFKINCPLRTPTHPIPTAVKATDEREMINR